MSRWDASISILKDSGLVVTLLDFPTPLIVLDRTCVAKAGSALHTAY